MGLTTAPTAEQECEVAMMKNKYGGVCNVDKPDKRGYCLDKDTINPGNKVYSRANCCFIPYTENIREANRRNPNITQKAHEANKTKYALELDGVTLLFDSEKAACEFLGVKKCSVSSCYHKGYKCKGYNIARMDGE